MAIVDSFDEVGTLQLYLYVITADAVQLFVPYFGVALYQCTMSRTLIVDLAANCSMVSFYHTISLCSVGTTVDALDVPFV